MKGYIQGKTIILLEDLPEKFKEGDEVEILIQNLDSKKSRFTTSKLNVIDAALRLVFAL